MVDVNSEVLQAAGQATYGLDLNGALRRATGLDLDKNGVCRRLWNKEWNACQDELSLAVGNHALLLDGGGWASTPDHATLDITGDFELQVELVSSLPSGNQTLLSKWTNTTQRSYRMLRSAFGTVDVGWTTAGSTPVGENILPTFVPNAIAVSVDVDGGATNRIITFYTATSIDGPWTQAQQFTRAGVTSVHSGTAPLVLGAEDSGSTNRFTGRITRARVYAGLTRTDLRANPDFRDLAPGTTSFADSTGKTWTLGGTAQVV